MAAETATINTRTSSAAKTPSSYGRITPTQTQADIHPHVHTHIVFTYTYYGFKPGPETDLWFLVPWARFPDCAPPPSDGPLDDGFQLTLSVSKFTYLINE